MKDIEVARITETVASLCVGANCHLPEDVKQCLFCAAEQETDKTAKSILEDLKQNLAVADCRHLPICQDTGMAVVFIELGQEVHLVGGLLEEAVNEGVRRGYERGFLRRSVVGDPLRRVNTGDNTPAVIHLRLVEGETVRITVAPKGFGSENKSGLTMLTPFDGREGVVKTVLQLVEAASDNPCPPMVIGVGIGGDFESCALLAKQALCRPLSVRNPDPYYAQLEEELLEKVNRLGIGPQGFGGRTTALGLNVETAPTHIAGLPVAVNIGCHVTRHQTAVIS